MSAGPQALDAEELRRVCEVVYRRTGMTYGEAKRYFVERRVLDHMARSNSGSFAAYMTLLRWDEGEVERLINSFTVNETYFYREEHQLRCLGGSILPEIVGGRRPGDLVRIWSFPCATGEEPYSIALWLLENWRLVDAYNVEIVGSDVDTEALAAAAQGIYGERALSRLPAGVVAGYFEPPADGLRRIIADIRESVKLTRANLVDAASHGGAGPVRRRVLPQRAHLFRRGGAARRRPPPLRRPEPRRLPVSRPHGIHGPHLGRVRGAALRGGDRLPAPAGRLMEDLLEEFLIEGRELVQAAGDDLLALERAPGDAARLDGAFRAVHTLKGGAALFADLAPMVRALHAAEDLLGALQGGTAAGCPARARRRPGPRRRLRGLARRGRGDRHPAGRRRGGECRPRRRAERHVAGRSARARLAAP